MRFKLFNLFLLFVVTINAQNTAKTAFEAQELKSDVEFFFSELEERHPNLYYYYPKDSALQAKENILRELNDNMSALDLAKLIEFNTNRLFDGHTGLKRYFGSRGLIPESAFLFPPKQIRVERGNIYIGERKVFSINGKPADELVVAMRNLIEAGKHPYIKDCTIEDNFSVYYYHLYGDCNRFEVEVEQEGEKSQIVLEGAIKKEIYNDNNTVSNFGLIIKNDMALLTVNRFDRELFEAFQTFLDSSFHQIREANVGNLFIDISENSGGSDNNVNLLLDYIYPIDYYFLYGYYEEKNEKEGLENGGENWDRTHAVTSPYLGKVYVLQSYKTFSAAMDFSSAIKSSNRGILIGEMTSDPAYSLSNAIVFELPHSGLEIGCATGFYAMPSGSHNCNVGILPDVYCHRKELHALKQDTSALFKYFESMIAKYGERQNAIELLKLFE